jgi:thiol:disulfide interchange protein DsbD
MEANIFTLPEVQELFREFVLVRLYTDGGEAQHERNQKLERERFGTIALPFYALISAEDTTLATFPGLTRDADEFIAFLRQGLQTSAAAGLIRGGKQ